LDKMHQNSAAKLFAQQPEGFDPHRQKEYNLSGPNADKLKETLAANARKAEEEWAAEHKFQGPKPMDDDEAAFLQRTEDTLKIRRLEREIEDLSEVEMFHREVKTKVYSTEPVTAAILAPPPSILKLNNPEANPVISIFSQIKSNPKKDEKKKIITIVHQKKRKTDWEDNEEDEKSKDNSKKETKEPAKKTKQVVKKKDEPPNALLGLADYGEDSD